MSGGRFEYLDSRLIDYSDLSDMIVAVEIIDYKDSDRTTLFEEDDDE